MKKLLIIMFLALCSDGLLAQKSGNIWHFGRNAGIDFNSGAAVPFAGSSMSTQEGCATICDSLGKLLFYTNGETVWNRSNQVMQNGTGLGGYWSATQSVLIVQQPVADNVYYVFTLDGLEHLGKGGLCYSIIDMNGDGGLGSVVKKAQMLYAPVAEKLTGTIHKNGEDVWIISHEWESDVFYAHLLTSQGLSSPPIKSKTGRKYGLYNSSYNGAWGQMKVSPDGRMAATALGSGPGFDLFSFDNATGVLRLDTTLLIKHANQNSMMSPYGLEFSPDNSRLYGTNLQYLFQYDVVYNQVKKKVEVTGEWDTMLTRYLCALQLAPDGRIYCACLDNDPSVIRYPDKPGPACGLEHNAVDLDVGNGGQHSYWGLPNGIKPGLIKPKDRIYYSQACLPDSIMFSFDSYFRW